MIDPCVISRCNYTKADLTDTTQLGQHHWRKADTKPTLYA
uniref:Uncharacterized protein n=1 Tax=Anguilla anguilla TaxID=7936 RepID=A0A0E9VQC7_ANGAN